MKHNSHLHVANVHLEKVKKKKKRPNDSAEINIKSVGDKEVYVDAKNAWRAFALPFFPPRRREAVREGS